MKILKIFIYLLSIPLVLFLHLFFSYVNLFNLLLLFSIFSFRNMKMYGNWWLLLLVSLLVDVCLHLFLGSTLVSILGTLIFLAIVDRVISVKENIFFDLLSIFFALIIYSAISFLFSSLQESSSSLIWNFDILLGWVIFAGKNIVLYGFFKIINNLWDKYLRNNVLDVI